MTKEQNEQLNNYMESFVRAIELAVDSEEEFEKIIKSYITTLALTCVDFDMPKEITGLKMTLFMLEINEVTFNLLSDMYSENPKGESHNVKYNVEDFLRYKNRRSTDKED